MILIGFILISSIFFIFAAISGNIGYFVNYDSALILVAATLIFSACTFKWSELVNGLKTMVVVNIHGFRKDGSTASHFKSLIIVTIAVGLISTAQGVISHVLAIRDLVDSALHMPLAEAFCYASFTTVYALIISILLFYPVYLLNCD